MLTPKKDLIFNGSEFNTDFLHNGKGECPYCFLNFMHQHKKGSFLKDFIMIDTPKETWEDRFDEEFKNLELDPERRELEKLKDFIRREFI